MNVGTDNEWVKGAVYAALVVLIVIFVMTGPGTARSVASNRTWVAEVGSTKIYNAEIDALYSLTQNSRRGSGRSATDVMAAKKRIAESRALVHLLADRAEAAGLAVGTDELRCYIVNWHRSYQSDGERICERFPANIKDTFANPDFAIYSTDDGKIEADYADRVRGYFGMSVDDYEAYKRRELLAFLYLDTVSLGVDVPRASAERVLARRQETVELEYVKLDPAATGDLTPTAAQLDAFLLTDAAAIAEDYRTNESQWQLPRKVQLRRIYIKKENEGTLAADRGRLEAAQARVAASTDFESIARELSELERERDQGGDMGLRDSTSLAADIFEATAGMKVGDTKTVESEFSWSIIKLETEEPARTRPLAEVQREIAEKLLGARLTSEASAQIGARGARILALAASQPLADAVAAEQAEAEARAGIVRDGSGEPSGTIPSFTVESTGAFAREQTLNFQGPPGFRFPPQPADNIPRIGKSRTGMQQVFALTSAAPLLGSLLEVDGKQYVVRLKERKPAPATFTDVEVTGILAELRGEIASEVTADGGLRRAALVPYGNVEERAPFLEQIIEAAKADSKLKFNDEYFTVDPVEAM